MPFIKVITTIILIIQIIYVDLITWWPHTTKGEKKCKFWSSSEFTCLVFWQDYHANEGMVKSKAWNSCDEVLIYCWVLEKYVWWWLEKRVNCDEFIWYASISNILKQTTAAPLIRLHIPLMSLTFSFLLFLRIPSSPNVHHVVVFLI